MLPASFAAAVPEFMATPTSACARAGASLVPSPVMATSRPPDCSRRISSSLSSGVASARKSSTPDSSAMARAVSGLSPVIMTVRMPIVRSSAKRSAIPGLTTSVSSTMPLTPSRSATASGVPPRWEMSLAIPRSSCSAPDPPTQPSTAETAPLRTSRPPVSIPDMRVWAENGTNSATASSAVASGSRPNSAWQSSTTDRPSGVVSARLERRAAPARSAASTPRSGCSRVARRLP